MTAPEAIQAKRKRESGATIVEFGIVLLPTLGFMFLLMNLTWIIFEWACVQESIREGVRAAVTCVPTGGHLNTTATDAIQQYSFGFINSSNLSSVVNIQYLDPTTLNPIGGGVTIYSGDLVKITISGLKVSLFAPIMYADLYNDTHPMYVGAVSADVIACRAPANP
jgi:hypothetical protein